VSHIFYIRPRNQNQTSFYPFVPHEISVLVELILGHLRYLLTDVPPQPNSPPDNVFRPKYFLEKYFIFQCLVYNPKNIFHYLEHNMENIFLNHSYTQKYTQKIIFSPLTFVY
ncbi:hypothetical protein CFOL_v3_25062, partial [Cephalotus follicularis]